MIYCANSDTGDRREKAQHELLAIYGQAIQRYLLGALRDENIAADVYQDFAVRFLRGDFKNATQEKGRFRGFLKVVLSRMVSDHYRQLKRKPTAQLDSQIVIPDDADQEYHESEFARVWRDQMLTMAWELLAEEQRKSNKPWLTVLRMRVENPDMRSVMLADQLSETLGEEVTPTHYRVLLHRAREKFSRFLINTVAETLRDNSLDAIEEELANMELLQYCQSTLTQQKKSNL
jgi:RNA polymerase sigma-70 factor (ECF subfamily)